MALDVTSRPGSMPQIPMAGIWADEWHSGASIGWGCAAGRKQNTGLARAEAGGGSGQAGTALRAARGGCPGAVGAAPARATPHPRTATVALGSLTGDVPRVETPGGATRGSAPRLQPFRLRPGARRPLTTSRPRPSRAGSRDPRAPLAAVRGAPPRVSPAFLAAPPAEDKREVPLSRRRAAAVLSDPGRVPFAALDSPGVPEGPAHR